MSNYSRLIDVNGVPLFEYECLPRNHVEREKVLKDIEPLCPQIAKAVMKAEDGYQAYAAEHPIGRQGKNFAPMNMTWLIIEKLLQIEGIKATSSTFDYPNVEIQGHHVWVKKVDDSLLPKFNLTKASAKRSNQFCQDGENEPILILGYQLNSMQKVVGIHLEYLKGQEHLWSPINVGDIGAKYLQKNSIFMQSNSSVSDEVEVKVQQEKKRAKKQIG